MSLSEVIQSSAPVTGVQTWFPPKELNIKLLSTTPAKHIVAILLDFRVQTNWPDFLACKKNFDNRIFRPLHVASVMVSKIKFEEKQSRFWKSQNGSPDYLCRSTDCFHNNPRGQGRISSVTHLCIRLHQSNIRILLKAKVCPVIIV